MCHTGDCLLRSASSRERATIMCYSEEVASSSVHTLFVPSLEFVKGFRRSVCVTERSKIESSNAAQNKNLIFRMQMTLPCFSTCPSPCITCGTPDETTTELLNLFVVAISMFKNSASFLWQECLLKMCFTGTCCCGQTAPANMPRLGAALRSESRLVHPPLLCNDLSMIEDTEQVSV